MKLKWVLRGLLVVTTVLLVAVLWLRLQLVRSPVEGWVPPQPSGAQTRDGVEAVPPTPTGLPVLGAVPDFQLVEASGRPIALADLKGQAWVAAFIFTRCAGTCPVMSTAMSALPPGNYRLVSFSVDPAHDTPAVLTEYAVRFHADRARWFFVTGDKPAIRHLATQGFHLTAEDATAGDTEPIVHSSHLVLVDRTGQIRGYYDGTDATAIDRLTRDLRRL